MNMLGIGAAPTGPTANIVKAENGFIVSTVEMEYGDDPQHAMSGDPALPPRQVWAPVMKTHVFDDAGDALDFVRKYLDEDWPKQ